MLFDELRLGESEEKTLRRKRQPGKKGRKAVCEWDTSSASLRLLHETHPLPALIVEHRRLSAIIRSASQSSTRSKREVGTRGGGGGGRDSGGRKWQGSRWEGGVADVEAAEEMNDPEEGGAKADEIEIEEQQQQQQQEEELGRGFGSVLGRRGAQPDQLAAAAAAAAASSEVICSQMGASALPTSQAAYSQMVTYSQTVAGDTAASSQQPGRLLLGGDGNGVRGGAQRSAPPSPPQRRSEMAVYCTFDQTTSATGRLHATEPNLQCLPKAFCMVRAARYTLDSLHAELSAAVLPPDVRPGTCVRVLRCSGTWCDAEVVAVRERVVADPYDKAKPETLAELYAKHNQPYAPDDARAVRQVQVRMRALAASSDGREREQDDEEDDARGEAGVAAGGGGRMHMYTHAVYPADRVFRVYLSTSSPRWEALRPPQLAHVLSGGDEATIDLRKGFVARPGCVLISADYAQVELRVLAHLADDRALIQAFDGVDLFRAMSARLFDVPIEQVSDTVRGRVKALTYAILYGAGVNKLTEDLEISVEQAREYMQYWRTAYPGVERYLEQVKKRCRANGYIETISGRRRYLPYIKAREDKARRGAERQAINSTVQGSAADLIKQAMIDIDAELNPTHGPAYGAGALSGRLLLQIHDELIFEVDEEHAPALRAKVRRAMESVSYGGALKVPLRVQVKQGYSWGDLAVVPDEQ